MALLRGLLCGGLILLVVTPGAVAQSPSVPPRPDTTAVADSLREVGLRPVVVSATRTEHTADEVAVPVSVIGREEIEAQGTARLSDLLSDQPGLTINSDHGAGLQMRGLGPEYTKILIDGEPVIGRTAGTLDLERLTTSNVERIEIVRGPTSSLYGSDALAGVVNLITERPDGPLGGQIRTRYGTHQTVDLSARIAGQSGPWQGAVFVDRYQTDGYDLASETLTPTKPGYVDYTAQGRARYEVGAQTTLSVRGRLASQSQDYTVGVADPGAAEVPHDQTASRLDWSVSPEIEQSLGAGWTLTGSLYGAGFHTEQTLRHSATGTIRSASSLDQYHGEGEAVVRGTLGSDHLLTVGGGALVEAVDAERKQGRRRGGFGFVQDEWSPTDALAVTGSVRLDANSDYASRLSPTLAAQYEVFDDLSVRASVGSGYKAPAFRQLFLDFTNPQVGYTVLGVSEVQDGLQRLQEQGRIEALLREPSALGDPLRPETSWAYNIGLTATPIHGVAVDLNVYHNEVSNLIDTEAVATKTNDQRVFTYVNRNEVFTRGLEAHLTVRPVEPLSVRLSYDYLEAKDRQVVDALEAGEIFRREDGRDVRVSPSDYGGLPGRSTHSGTLQLRYTVVPVGLTASIRGTFRGRYGDADRNGNNIVDVPREYVDGHTLWDATLSKTLFGDHTLRVGAENLTGYTNPGQVPSLSGRRWFAEVQARF